MNKEGTWPQRTQKNVKARVLFWDLGVYCLTHSLRHSTQFNFIFQEAFKTKGKKIISFNKNHKSGLLKKRPNFAECSGKGQT